MDQEDNNKMKDSKLLEEVDSLIKQSSDNNVPEPINPGSKRGSKDVSNAVPDRRSSYLQAQMQGNSILQQLSDKEKQVKSEKQRKFRQTLGMFLNSRLMDYLIILLVGMFMCITFINFSFSSNDAANNESIALTLYVVSIFEMVILGIFLLEIVLKSYSFGLANYFKDGWLIFDVVVIILSIIMLVLDWTLQSGSFKTASKVIRGVFRFLRMFLVFRKFNQAKTISIVSQRYHVRSPIEKVVEIIKSMIDEFDDKTIKTELKWSIEQITSNKLYEPMVDTSEKNNNDASNWVDSLQKKSTQTDKKKHSLAVGSGTRTGMMGLNIPAEVFTHFESELLNLDFECFELHNQHKNLILPFILDYLFEQNGLYQRLQIDSFRLKAFGGKIASGYKDNEYHNVIHAFDVTQTVNFFLTACDFKGIAQLGNLDIMCMIVGAAIHDYEHPGTNNPFQINARTDLALTYNDKSPLENHHLAASFFVLSDNNFNIFENLTREDLKYVRERFIGMILATDMANHFPDLAKLKVRLVSPEFDMKEKDKVICMESLLHAADVSNPFKPFSIYEKWTYRVLEEFWKQGDKERAQGIPVSYLCDRYTTNTAKSQIGFIDFVVLPFYEALHSFLPLMTPHMINFENNKNAWKERIDFYEEELKQLATQRQETVTIRPA